MSQFNITLENADGLHARPAAVLAQMAAKFQSKIELKAKGQSKNAKSIMSIMALGLEKGDAIEVVADGPDADQALTALKTLFANNLQA